MSWKDYYTAITGQKAPSEQASPSGTVYGTTPSRTSPLEDYYNEQMQQKQATEKARDIIDGRGRGLVGGLRDSYLDKHPNVTTISAKDLPSANQTVYDLQQRKKELEGEKTKNARYSLVDGVLTNNNTDYDAEIADIDKRIAETKKQDDYRTVWDKLVDTVTGAVTGSAASKSDAMRTLYESGQNSRTAEYEREIAQLQKDYDRAKRDYEETLELEGEDAAQWAKNTLDDVERKLNAYKKVVDENVQQKATQATADLADQLQQDSAERIERAKDGSGAVGRFAVDAGVAATQMGIDALTGRALGIGDVGSKASMALRAFGGGTQEARQGGGDINQQLGYGGGVAVVELITEKLFDGLAGIYGKGTLDKVTEGVIGRLAKTDAGRTALRVLEGGIGEGSEELISDALNPLLRTIYNGKTVGESYGEEQIADWGYDFLVGAVLGAGGKTVDIATGEDAKKNAKLRSGEIDKAFELMTGKKAASEPQSTAEAQGDITTPPTPSNDAMARPEKLNSTANNESEAKGAVQPEAAPRTAPETSETPSSRETPPSQPSASSEQPGVPGKQRERGFSENVRTDNAMENDIRQSFDSNPEMYSQLSNSDTLAKARTIYEKGFQTARSTVDKALGAAKSGQKLAPEMVPLSRMVANELSRMGEVEAARNMLADVATELTAAGQLNQAARIMRDSDPNTALRSIERTLDAINEEFSKQHKHSKWKAELTDAEREKILSTDFTEEGAYQSVYEEIAKRIGKEMPSSAFEKLTEIRRINMLLRPKTMIKNVVSNVPMVGLRKGAETLSIGIQSALTKMGAMDSSKRTRGMASKAQKQLANDFYEANKGDINGQSNKWDMKSMLRENRTIFKGGAIEKAMSKMTGKEIQPFGEALRQVTYDLLEKGDAPFVKSAFVDSLSQYCAAKGITTKEGITREAIDFATANAMEATFKNANLIASLINKVKRESSPGVAMAVDVLIPFTTTPANILTLMGDYSPVGFAKMLAKDGPAAKIDAFSKATVGSAIMALGFALRNADMITGGEDDDKDKAALDKATGRGNYSIGGKVSYDWAQPAGSLLAFGAEIADAIKGQESWVSALMNAIYTAGDSTLNLSLFQNVISVLKGSGKPTQQIIDSIMEGGATQLVPGLAGDIAKIIDGTVRSTYTGGNVVDDTAAKVKAVTPFLSKSLPESVNVKGETNTRGELAERTFNTLINPFNVTRGKRNEVDEEIYRLYDSTGSTTFYPSLSPYKIDYDNSTYKLDGKDREAFQKTQGQTYYQLAKPLLDSEMYKALSDEQKANVLNSIRDYALDAAKRQLVEGRGGDYSTSWDDESELESPSEFLAAKQALSDGANGKSDNFDVIDQVLKNFGHLKDDTQTALRDSTGLYVDKLLYAESKGIKSKDWFDIYAAIKDYKKQTDSGSDSTAAIAVGNAVKGTDAEKLAALEAQLTPDGENAKNPGKRNATVRRYEAAIDNGVSYDTWAKIEAALNEIAPGKTPNRNEIYAAAAQSGTGVKGSTAYWIYKKYSSDETKVEQYDYSYGNSGGDSTETNSDNSTSTAIKSWDDYMKFLGMTK